MAPGRGGGVSLLTVTSLMVMMVMLSQQISTASAAGAAAGSRDHFWYPVYTSCNKIQSLTASEYEQVTKGAGSSLVAFLNSADSDDTTAMVLDVLYAVTPLLTTDNTCSVYRTEVPTGASDIKEGDIHLYSEGHRRVFQGYRSADSVLNFVAQATSPAVQILRQKTDKKLYESVYVPKVLAYFDIIDSDRLLYRDVANQFHPNIRFFEVSDPTVAGDMMKSSPMGTIQIKLPYEKQPLVFTRDPAIPFDQDLADFIKTTRRPYLRTASTQDVHHIWDHNPDEAMVVAFTRHKSALHKLLQSRVKRLTEVKKEQKPQATIEEPAAVDPLAEQAQEQLAAAATAAEPVPVPVCGQDMNVVVLDPDTFPQLYAHWQRLFGVQFQDGQLGLINKTDHTAAWFDMSQLALQQNDNGKMAAIGQWLCDIASGVVRVDGLQPEDRQQTVQGNLGSAEGNQMSVDERMQQLIEETLNPVK